MTGDTKRWNAVGIASSPFHGFANSFPERGIHLAVGAAPDKAFAKRGYRNLQVMPSWKNRLDPREFLYSQIKPLVTAKNPGGYFLLTSHIGLFAKSRESSIFQPFLARAT